MRESDANAMSFTEWNQNRRRVQMWQRHHHQPPIGSRTQRWTGREYVYTEHKSIAYMHEPDRRRLVRGAVILRRVLR